MHQVVVTQFGGPEVLEVREVPTPTPGAGEVLVRLTSIGMNHAELMGRRGDYKLSTGDPPFTPGLEGGGVVEAVGGGVDAAWIGKRVVLLLDTPRLEKQRGGTYRSHYLCTPDDVIEAPDTLPDELLGALWLSHYTAWGALVFKHGQRGYALDGAAVGIPAASSALGLAAAQVVRHHGGTAIGLTTSPDKTDAIADDFDHLVTTHDPDRKMRPWHRDLKAITDGRGVDVFFDPVAAGAYLDTEIRALANHGTIYLYGLLGTPGTVDVSPLIRKQAAMVGYINAEGSAAGRDTMLEGCRHVLDGFAAGHYRQRVAQTFALDDVQRAHAVMERGGHVGKLVLVP